MVFFDKNDMLLACEFCEKHRYVNCLGMTKAVYKAISGRTDLPWFCSNYIEKSLTTSVRQTKSIEEKHEQFITEFQKKSENRIHNIEKELNK